MSNLWEETIEFLKENDKTFEDVLFIQGEDFKVTKENFETVAKDTEYDSGYGAQHVPKDLVLVGEDWWIERYEYDYADSCYRHYFLGFYGNVKPKFMRNRYNKYEREGKEVDYVEY